MPTPNQPHLECVLNRHLCVHRQQQAVIGDRDERVHRRLQVLQRCLGLCTREEEPGRSEGGRKGRQGWAVESGEDRMWCTLPCVSIVARL
eukprot:363308-Chlamydomonas_euryale.AAC.11